MSALAQSKFACVFLFQSAACRQADVSSKASERANTADGRYTYNEYHFDVYRELDEVYGAKNVVTRGVPNTRHIWPKATT